MGLIKGVIYNPTILSSERARLQDLQHTQDLHDSETLLPLCLRKECQYSLQKHNNTSLASLISTIPNYLQLY